MKDAKTKDTILVIYDSEFGNTAKVAQAVASGLGAQAKCITDVSLDSLTGIKLVVVGSPTQGGTMTHAMQAYLKEVPARSLEGVVVAAFDTRFVAQEQKAWLRLLMGLIGYAAPKILSVLESKGGKPVAESVGFIVTDKKGPLKDGELERARAWGNDLRGMI